MQRLLVSVRGPNEAVEAAKGGAHIADVEFPTSDGLHSIGKEVWMAESVIREQMAPLWATGADVICVRSAACAVALSAGPDRFGEVRNEIVRDLVATIP